MFHTQPKTYNKIPCVLYNYFRLRCSSNGYGERGYTGTKNDDERTYRVEVWSRETDNVMQKILDEANNS